MTGFEATDEDVLIVLSTMLSAMSLKAANSGGLSFGQTMSTEFSLGRQDFPDSKSAHREVAFRWIDTQCAGALELRLNLLTRKSDGVLTAQCIKELKEFGEHPSWLNEQELASAFAYQRESEAVLSSCIWLASRIKDGDPRSIGQPLVEAMYAQPRARLLTVVQDVIAQRAMAAAVHVGKWWADTVKQFGGITLIADMAQRAFRANPNADVFTFPTGDGGFVAHAMFDGIYVKASGEHCEIFRAMGRSASACCEFLNEQMDGTDEYLLAEWTVDAKGRPVEITAYDRDASTEQQNASTVGMR